MKKGEDEERGDSMTEEEKRRERKSKMKENDG